MPIFITYDMSNVESNKSLIVEGSIEDARAVFNQGSQVFIRHKNWDRIKWRGVNVPRFIPHEFNTIPAQLAMYLDIFRQENAIHPFDKKAVKNFERACRAVFGINIDTRYIPQQLGSWETPSVDFQEAIVNSSDRVRVNNWQLQRPSISRTGALVPGADANTVVYNTSSTGTFWLARWVYKSKHFFATLTEPYFEDVSYLFNNTNGDEMSRKTIALELDTFGNSREIVYEDKDTDSDDTDKSDSEPLENVPEVNDNVFEEVDDFETRDDNGVEFELFTAEEKKMLPLGYMTPRSIEWQYMMEAISSQFIQVKNLVKVRDLTIRDFYTILGMFPIYKRYAVGAHRLYKYIKQRFLNDIEVSLSKLRIED